jgi:hypothetical protein
VRGSLASLFYDLLQHVQNYDCQTYSIVGTGILEVMYIANIYLPDSTTFNCTIRLVVVGFWAFLSCRLDSKCVTPGQVGRGYYWQRNTIVSGQIRLGTRYGHLVMK